MPKKKSFSPALQRGLMMLIICLMGISIARLLTTMHQQQERIEILEASVAQLMADTSRLQIPAPYYGYEANRQQHDYYHRDNSGYRRNDYYHRSQHPTSGQHPESRQDPPSANPGAAPASDTTSRQGPTPAPSPTPDGRIHKFTEPHRFDLNTVDSLTLIRIPGIASHTASVILRNRQRYGGFHNVSQIREFLTWDAALVYMDDWCTLWFTADASRLIHLPVNSASIAQL